MRIKLCQPDGHLLGYMKVAITTEAEIPGSLEFQGREYNVTHRITIGDNIIKVIVNPVESGEPVEETEKKKSFWQKLFGR